MNNEKMSKRKKNFLMALFSFIIAKIAPYLFAGILASSIAAFFGITAVVYLVFGIIAYKLKEENEKKYKYATLAVAFIVVSASYIYMYKTVNNFVSYPRLIITKPIDGVTATSNSVYVIGVTEKDVLVKINDNPILVDEKGEFDENIELTKGSNIINVKAMNKYNKETIKSVSINAVF